MILVFQLVAINPVENDPGCSWSARVSSLSKSWSKTQAIITAEDTNSPGHVLR